MKRVLSTLLAVVLLLGCLSVTAMAEEVPTLTIGIPSYALVSDYYDNDFTRYMEEKVGCKIEFVFYTSEYKNQLALQIAAKEELPDILFNFYGLGNLRNQYGEDGFFLDMKPLLEEYCETFWYDYEFLTETDKKNIFAYGADPANGCLYAIPGIEETTLMVTEHPAIINKAWLDAVGEEMPRTVEDLYRVLQKFATEDPNGNGLADEIPVLGSTSGFMQDIIQYLMNAFVHVDDNFFWNATDGELWAPYVTDEYREGLIYLNQLYSEGLISPLVFTMNKNESSSTIKTACSPLDGVPTAGISGNCSALDLNNGAATAQEYVAFPPLLDATGKGGYTPMGTNTYQYSAFLTSSCKDIELAMKFIDELYSWDTYLIGNYGAEGVHWERIDGMNNRGSKAQVHVLDTTVSNSQNNITWHQYATGMKQLLTAPDGYICSTYTDDGSWNAWLSNLQKDIFNATYEARQLEEPIFTIIRTAEEEEALKDTDYGEYYKEARALFITGALDPNSDSDWQNYLDEMEARGLYVAQEINQTAYDRMMGK